MVDEKFTFWDSFILGCLSGAAIIFVLFGIGFYQSPDCSSIVYGDWIVSTDGFYNNNQSMTVVGYNDTHWKTREPFTLENKTVWILKNESKEWRCK